ncbi:MAG: hypothetical protein CYG61_09335 [Actinobacteria bacterium]|jgi:hypothetical protein|nr:MAG: hypothetical protein CYG61_09335 [Actinomycetota bacterium]
MDDAEVLAAFAGNGARKAFGPMLHIEGDNLYLDGWWQASLRIADDTFIVRDEQPPVDTTLMADLQAALTGKGLQQVGADLPGVTMITYTEFTLGGASWIVWAPDLATAEANLNARVTRETFFEPAESAEAGLVGDEAHLVGSSAELGGARRVAGLPPALVLAVGVSDETAAQLDTVLDGCSVKTVSFAAGLDTCSSIIPTLIVVDATDQTGREFIMELRAAACGRFIPVAALAEGGDVPLGAEAVLDPAAEPASWVAPIRDLLP